MNPENTTQPPQAEQPSGLSGIAGSGLLPCPFCGVIPTAKTERWGFSMWDEWVNGKPVHQGAENFSTEFRCSDECLLGRMNGARIHAKIDYRDSCTRADLHAAACRRWNTRPNTGDVPIPAHSTKPKTD